MIVGVMDISLEEASALLYSERVLSSPIAVIASCAGLDTYAQHTTWHDQNESVMTGPGCTWQLGQLRRIGLDGANQFYE